MSVIHEAVKRARQDRAQRTVQEAKTQEVTTLRAGTGAGGSWILWVLSALVILEAGALVWVKSAKDHAEGKLTSAYLELNDVRGEYLDTKKGLVDTEARLASENRALQTKLKELQAQKADIAAAKQSVEFDNLKKEKTLASLTKQAHESEMAKLHLEDEVRSLKAELAKRASNAEAAPRA